MCGGQHRRDAVTWIERGAWTSRECGDRATADVVRDDPLPAPPPAWAAQGKGVLSGSGKDLSFENSLSYDLIGGRLKAHVGHEVEIIGITSDARLTNRDALSSAIGSSKHEKTTLTVDSVKMLAAKCR
jgi:hypothetical protein